MSRLFTPETTAGQQVQKIFLEYQDGLSLAQIQSCLRRKGKMYTLDNLRELLDNHPDFFVRHANGIYQLKSVAPTNSVSPEDEKINQETSDVETSIQNLPFCLSDYIVFDLETTGLNPQMDRIIQISALKVKGGIPVDVLDLYCSPAPNPISYALKVKLGFDIHVEREQRTLSAPTVEQQIDEFLVFIGKLPLIAHNGRFDMSFLKVVATELDNPLLDTMELSHLVFPTAKTRKLEALAKKLNITSTNSNEASIIKDIVTRLRIEFSWKDFHSSMVDVIYLYRVYAKMLERLQNCPHQLANAIATLFPELTRIVSGIPQTKLSSIVTVLAQEPSTLPSNTELNRSVFVDSFSVKAAEELLEQFLDQRGYQRREGQVTMTRSVSESMFLNRLRMIEAPTGTGKTLAYLLPSILWALSSGERIAISTTVKNLQDQLVDELVNIAETLNLPFRFCKLKGQSNYFCLSRFQQYLNEIDLTKLTNEEKLCIVYLFAWLTGEHDGGLDSTSFWFEMNFPLFSELKFEFAEQPNLPCHFGENCFFASAYRSAMDADVLVINHALWFSEAQAMPQISKIIFDEAHHLEEIATSAWTKEVSYTSLFAIYNRLQNLRTRRGLLARIQKHFKQPDIVKLLQRVRANLTKTRQMTIDFGHELVKFIKSCNAVIDEKYGAKLRIERNPKKIEPIKWYSVERAKEQLQKIYLADLISQLQDLHSLLSTYSRTDELNAGLMAIIEALAEQYSLMDKIVQVSNMKYVYWVEVNPQEPENTDTDYSWGLKVAPIEVAPLLAAKYQTLSTAIFTSATLSVRGGDFSFFVNRLGLTDRLLDDDIVLIPATGLDYRNAFLGLTNYLNHFPVRQTMESFKQEMSDELCLFFNFTSGRGLVLFTAAVRLAYAAERCEPRLSKLSLPLYWQREGISRKALMDEFREYETSVLFGLQSFWEGVDVPGKSLSFVVMEKLPFPFLGDPLFKARREKAIESGLHEFDDYIFPLMAIQFKQGFGRLMRKKDDRGAVLLLDRRIHTKSYRFELLKSLPGYTRTQSAESSRKALYQAIAAHLPDLLSDRDDFIANLPDELLTDLLKKISEYELPAIMSEEEYELYRESHILPAISEVMVYPGFRSSEQEEIVRAILTGHDTVGLLPTGAGKSFCFQFPALLRRGTTIVFSPLIALMRDQVESQRRRGIEIVDCIYSGQRADEREEVFRRMRKSQARLVYISPERLRDIQLIECLRETNVIQVVVDEAHCISLWGTSFRPDFFYIPKIFDKIQYTGKRPPIAAFTATATPAIKQDIIEKLEMEDATIVQASFDRPELRLVVYNSTSTYNPIRSRLDKFRTLLKIVKAAELNSELVLVYVSTTVEAETIARKLQLSGFNARFYHGKMAPEDRQSVQELFLDDMVSIVICTKAFGMGIDKPDVRYVVHYNIPSDIESYYQEAGRAGRELDVAYCVLLYHEPDLKTQHYFHQSALPSPIAIQNLITFLQSQKEEEIYLLPTSVCDLLGIEETELRILLYHLQAGGFIERKEDFTAKASLTLQVEHYEICDQINETFGQDASKFLDMLKYLDAPSYRSTNVILLELSQACGLPILEIERCFVQLALKGVILFRAYEKGIHLRLLPKLLVEKSFSMDSEHQSEIFESLELKLDLMVQYATTSEDGKCLRKQILTYFGETNPASRCGNCSICNPELELPWGKMTDRDLPSVSDYFDPAYTILQLVHWNEQLAEVRYRAPYGTGGLPYLLTGNDYQLLRNISDTAQRVARSQRLRECPYWGVLDSLPRREKAIRELMERLEKEDFITYTTRTFNSNGESVSYQYPILQEKGQQQLLEGQLLNWSV